MKNLVVLWVNWENTELFQGKDILTGDTLIFDFSSLFFITDYILFS